MGTIEIKSKVIKWKMGKTERDERDESLSGLTTETAFTLAGSPRVLARMAKLLKSGAEVELIVRCTEAIGDVDVIDIELPHQKTFDEIQAENSIKKPGQVDLTANAGFPPTEEKAEPGTTPIRTGEPIVINDEANGLPEAMEAIENIRKRQEEEANAQFDDLKSAGSGGNGDKPGVVLFDLNTQFEIKVPNGDGPYTITLDGCRKKSKNLVSGILTVFNSKAIKADTAEMLIDALLLYPQSGNRDMLLEVLRVGHMPEKQPA